MIVSLFGGPGKKNQALGSVVNQMMKVDNSEIQLTHVTVQSQIRAFDHQMAQNGKALAYLTINTSNTTSGQEDKVIFNLVKRDGSIQTFEGDGNWWQLGPELRPGHFGLLASTPDQTAILVDIDWSQQQIVANKLRELPFKIQRQAPAWQRRAFISPEWNYVAYVNGNMFELYSLSENKVLWQTNYDYNAIPIVIWGQSKDTISIIGFTGVGGQNNLISIDQNGNSAPFADLSAKLGAEVQVMSYTSLVTPKHQIAMQVQENRQGVVSLKLILLDLKNGSIIDLCGPTQVVQLMWAQNHRYLLATNIQSNTVSEWMFIEVDTGNRKSVTLNEPLLYPIGWSIPE